MTREQLEQLFGETLRSEEPSIDHFEKVADAVLAVVRSGSSQFLAHVRNRLGKLASSSGEIWNTGNFDLDAARQLVADEMGFTGWEQLKTHLESPAGGRPLLFHYAVAAMVRGDFTALEKMLGGRGEFHRGIREWLDAGYFEKHPETLAEIFAAACWLGHPETAALLLDNGVDPYAGMSTGLAGFHWAASRPHPEVIALLLARGIPTEVKNMYDGTVLGQALWSAINEWTPGHAEVIELLIKGGAHVWPGTLEWWHDQPVPDPETKHRVAAALRAHGQKQG